MLSIPFARLHALAIVLPLTLAAVAAEEPQAKKSDGPAGGGREAAEAPHGYFQRAWHYETAEGKVEEALAMYRGLAAQADAPGSLRAKALYRAAICLRKLQRPEEARDVLQRIGKEFPDVVEVAQAAQRELAEESSGDAIVRRKAEELLVELWTANRNGPGPVTPFAKATSDLEAIGPRAAPYVIDALAAVQPHPAADYLAAMLMRFVGTDASVAAAVRRLLREGPTETRLALLGALRWEKGGAEWRELIVELATDRDAKIRAAVARALRDDTDRTAHDTAVALAGDPVPAVRMAALWVLGQMLAGPGDLAVLRAAYADPDAGVRAAAVAAVKDTLGRAERGGEVDLSREVTLLADPSREVLAALVELFGAAPGGLPAGAIEPLARRIDELREFRGSPGPPGSGVGVPMPGKTPFDNAARLLIAKRAARALPVYIAVLAENREPLVADALEAVAAVGDAAAVPALLGLLTRKPEPRPAPVAGAPIRRAGGRSHTQTRAFEILTQELGSHATLEALAERLTDLQDFQNEALDKLLGSGSEDLAATVFVRFTRLGPQERRRIVSHPALARASRERAREVLDQALTDGEEEVRVEALKTIRSRFWSPEWVPALLAAYADSRRRSQENTAVAILRALASLADPRAVEVFLAALADQDPPLVAEAAKAFPGSWTPPTPVIERLLALLAPGAAFHPEPAAKLIARDARREDAPRLARALGEVVPEVRATLITTLAKLGERSVIPALSGAVEAAPEDTAVEAVRAIAFLGGAEALEPLLAAVLEARVGVRNAAIEGLASLPGETLRSNARVVETMEKMLAAPADPVQVKAVAVLARHGGRAAASALEGALASPAEDVQLAAAAALALLGDPSSVPALARALERTQYLEVTDQVGAALGAFRDPRAVEALVRRLGAVAGDGSPDAAKTVEGLIDSLSSYPPAAVVDALLPVLASPANEAARGRLLSLLARLDDPRAVDVLRTHLTHENPSLRRLAVEAAGARLDREVLPVLVERLRDPSPPVRKEAQASIERIRFYEEQRRLAGLGEPADRALQELFSLLEAEEPVVRASAARALARTGGAEALRALVRRRHDGDEVVRAAVEKALETITAKKEDGKRP